MGLVGVNLPGRMVEEEVLIHSLPFSFRFFLSLSSPLFVLIHLAYLEVKSLVAVMVSAAVSRPKSLGPKETDHHGADGVKMGDVLPVILLLVPHEERILTLTSLSMSWTGIELL
eukprot:g22882.t1